MLCKPNGSYANVGGCRCARTRRRGCAGQAEVLEREAGPSEVVERRSRTTRGRRTRSWALRRKVDARGCSTARAPLTSEVCALPTGRVSTPLHYFKARNIIMGKNFTAVFAVCLAISSLPLACGDDEDDGGGGGTGGSSGSAGKGGKGGTSGSSGSAGKGGTSGT